MRLSKVLTLVSMLLPTLVALPAQADTAPNYIEFEAGPVRPVAMSADRSRLYVCNIPDDRLSIFDITPSGLVLRATVPVGMSPIAVAERSPNEVWVVNHLSDSVSVVDIGASPPRVTRTLLVGDEPRDIVFAANGRAFVTTAHRGQQRVDPSIAAVPGAGDPELTTPGVGRADVWVFDPANLGSATGGVPVGIVTLFGDTPRALAVSGNTVYAAVYQSGNQTTVVGEESVCDGFDKAEWLTKCKIADGITVPGGLPNGGLPGGMPLPKTNHSGAPAPEAGLVVKYDEASGQWRDGFRRNWTNAVRFNLPDKDVFAIDADSLKETNVWKHVGTTLFNMAVNPANGKVYVSNTDSNNLTRFEGPGKYVREKFGSAYPMDPTIQGKLAVARISVLSPDSTVLPRSLNPHIDYQVVPSPPGTADSSLSFPLQVEFSSDGSRVYVAGYGSSAIGVIPTAALEDGTFDSTKESPNYIQVRGGPAGFALDEGRSSLYVLNRFENTVSRIDLSTRKELDRVSLYSPEPSEVVIGRPFLYDAKRMSSNGEASCASCHPFGDNDQLAWDLGNPDDDPSTNLVPQPKALLALGGTILTLDPQNGSGNPFELSSMKGVMTTQTLKGLVNQGPLHWRGDRPNGHFKGKSTAETLSASLSFSNFIVATVGCQGREALIADDDMLKYTAFAMKMALPPNPIRRLDNDLSKPTGQLTEGDPAAGRDYFFKNKAVGTAIIPTDFIPVLGQLVSTTFTCEGCHTVDPAKGYFGTDGTDTFALLKQTFKTPHLRNMYTKIGMFGQPKNSGMANESTDAFTHQGDQVRGFGLQHEGTAAGGFGFVSRKEFQKGGLGAQLFGFPLDPFVGFQSDKQRRDVEAYLYAFDNDLAPIVGQQVTLTDTNAEAVGKRIDLLLARADADFPSKILGEMSRECEVVAKTVVNGVAKGFWRKGDGQFYPDDGSAPLSDKALREIATVPGQAVTYTAVPFGSGKRMGIDRDLDGVLDGADQVNGDEPAPTNAAPPTTTPGALDGGIPDASAPEGGKRHPDLGAANADANGGGCTCRVGAGQAQTTYGELALLVAGVAVGVSRRRGKGRSQA